MLIGIEASRANRRQKTGVEWYAYFLIQALKQLPEAEAHSWLLYGESPLATDLARGPANWHEVHLAWPPRYLWTQLRLAWEQWRRPPHVFFVPAHVLPKTGPAHAVVTVHDIGFHHFPELYKPIQRFYHEYTTRDIIRRAARVIAVSEFTKQELVQIYGADASKIRVIYEGIDHQRYHPLETTAIEQQLSHWQLPRPFFLFIGRLEQKKNVLSLIEAFERFKQQRGVGDPMRLVLIGQPGRGYADMERRIQACPYRDMIHQVGYVSEVEKVAFLNAAHALIHPAWYEGFGLTPLEAMACGCPVLCSRVASLPEIVGEEQALWFSPTDVESLAQAMQTIVDEPLLRASLRDKGLVWVQRYTWQKAAQETLAALTQW